MRRVVVILSLSLMLFGGCSESGTLTVRGQLVNNGRPLSVDNPDEFELKLLSVDADGPGRNVYAARVERDGTFLFAGPTGRGVPPGAYKVVIETGPVPDGRGGAGDRFHKAFAEPRTPLRLTVTPGTTELTIDVGAKTVVPAANQPAS